ncbi:ATP-binding protein [Thermosulfuriphilus sp.]
MFQNVYPKICKIFSTQPDPAVGLDLQRKVLFINAAAQNLKREGDNCHQILFGRSTPCSFCPLEEAQAKEKARRIVSSDWGDYDLWLYLLEPDERIFVCSIRDISPIEEREKRRYLAKKMEALSRFAGNIAHNFNNLLAGVLGQLELLREEGLSEAAQRRLKQILDDLRQGAELTDKLLTIGMGQPIEVKLGDINQDIKALLVVIRDLLPERIRLESKLDPQLPSIHYDRLALVQILLNLISNAVDAMPQGGTVTVSTTLWNSKVIVLEVRDQGSGIPPEVQEFVFEPFFTTKKDQKRSGLGLSMAYSLAASMGGQVELESTPGQGSTFRILFPVRRRTVSAPKEKKIQEACRILVAEEDTYIRNLLKEALLLHGYEVEVAAKGERALELIEKKVSGFDILIVDLDMAAMGGLRIIEEALVRSPRAHFIVISGHETGISIPKIGQRIHFLQKPFHLKEILQIVKEVWERKKEETTQEESQQKQYNH